MDQQRSQDPALRSADLQAARASTAAAKALLSQVDSYLSKAKAEDKAATKAFDDQSGNEGPKLFGLPLPISLGAFSGCYWDLEATAAQMHSRVTDAEQLRIHLTGALK